MIECEVRLYGHELHSDSQILFHSLFKFNKESVLEEKDDAPVHLNFLVGGLEFSLQMERCEHILCYFSFLHIFSIMACLTSE